MLVPCFTPHERRISSTYYICNFPCFWSTSHNTCAALSAYCSMPQQKHILLLLLLGLCRMHLSHLHLICFILRALCSFSIAFAILLTLILSGSPFSSSSSV